MPNMYSGFMAGGTIKQYLSDSIRHDSIRRNYELYEHAKLDVLAGLAIDTFPGEMFEYVYSGLFPDCEFYILRAERNADSTFTLTSRYVLCSFEHNPNEPKKSSQIVTVKNFQGSTDSFRVFSSEQLLNENEWRTFREKLAKGNYWTYTDPVPNEDILDGGLLLQSKSVWPHYANHDTLTVHINFWSDPEGSFFGAAYHYLAGKSVLFRTTRAVPAAGRDWH